MADEINLNEEVVVIVEDASVITTPIDDTLSISGDAADAAAVGAALALKADLSQITGVTVNGQEPDAQGKILVNGTEIPMSGTDDTTLKEAIEAAATRTGADIPVNANPGAASIEQAIASAAGSLMSVTDNTLAVTGEITDGSTTMQNLRMGNTVLPVQDAGAVRSVNNVLPGASGNVQITTVDAARQLVSENTQLVEGTFVRRTSGGSTSIGTGAAYLGVIRGNSVHTGKVEESFTVTVTSSAQDPITAEVTTRATFRTQAEEGGTYTFNYTGSWDTDPATWGITVTGTPESGDTITVVWVEEVRGTITNATPTSFTGSNWNLYNNLLGYARVLKYSEDYGFGISGTYTALKFSTTLSGTPTAITPVNGIFTVPSDGYVWVTDGNATNTAIWMQDSDWQESYEGGFAAHHEDIISLTDAMQFFPNGLCSVGDVRDEINLNTQEAIIRIERIEYSAENLAEVIAAGRDYDADEDYIYAVYLDEDMPDPEDIEVDGSYTADDHGMEWFDDTEIEVYTQIIYGDNLVDKLRTDVLTKSQDLVDDLNTNNAKKALSAKQGKLLKDSLNTATTVSSVSSPVTWNATASNTGDCSATMYKMGKLRMLVFTISPKTNASTFTTYGTISSGNRPVTNMYVTVNNTKGSAHTQVVRITTSGTMAMQSTNISLNEAYVGTAVYFVP